MALGILFRAFLEADLFQAGGFAGGFFQAAVAHEMVLWDREHGCGALTAASGYNTKLICGSVRNGGFSL